jgi:hypothetical protein
MEEMEELEGREKNQEEEVKEETEGGGEVKKRFYLAFVGEIAREKRKENVCAAGFFVYDVDEFRAVRSYVVASEEDLPVDKEFLHSSPKIIESTIKYLKEKTISATFSISDMVYGKLLNLFTPYFVSTTVEKVLKGEDVDEEREKIVEVLSEIFRTRISVALATGFFEEEAKEGDGEGEEEGEEGSDKTAKASKVILRGAPIISPTQGIPAEEVQVGDIIKLKLTDVPEDLEKAIKHKLKKGEDYYLGAVSSTSFNEETGNVRLECYLGNNIYALLSVNSKTKLSVLNREPSSTATVQRNEVSVLSSKDYIILAGIVLFLAIFLFLLLK